MTDLPDTFVDQDHYDEWLDDLAENEVDEFLDTVVYGDAFHIGQIEDWANESPIFAGEDMEWARLYHDVRGYGYNSMYEMEILIPHEDPFRKTARAVRATVATDLANRMAMRIEDEHEVET